MNSIKTILSIIESKAIDDGLKFRDQLDANVQCKKGEVMRSEFERWLGDVWLSDAEWDESKNTYTDSRIHCMWSAWQHQQTKVDELTAQRDSFIKAYEIEVDKSVELQKRVDAVKQLIDDWNCGGVNLFDLLDELEQTLKGGDQ